MVQYKLHQYIFYIGLVSVAYAALSEPMVLLSSILWCAVLITCVTSAYYHRSLTHKSWTGNAIVQLPLLVLGAGHGMMSAINWTSAHLKHHRYSDTATDPHGPMRTIWENINIALIPLEIRYVRRDVLSNPLVVIQARYYWVLLILYAVVWAYCFGMLSWFVINGLVLLTHIAVNMLGHINNIPTNVPAFTILTGGELYHKNHHDAPRNVKFGSIDPGWWFIKSVCGVGLGTLYQDHPST